MEDQPGGILEDDRRCKIIIKNVSCHYSERAIRNLCGEFGEVCSVVRGPPTMDKNKAGYFFVTYHTLE